jgi:hypothetical protein
MDNVQLDCDCGATTRIEFKNYLSWVEGDSLIPPFGCEKCTKPNLELTENSIDDILRACPGLNPFMGKINHLIGVIAETEDQDEKYRAFRELFGDMKRNLKFVKFMGPSFVFSTSANINTFRLDGLFSKDEKEKENGSKLYEEFKELLV